jgi:hypothetical protein
MTQPPAPYHHQHHGRSLTNFVALAGAWAVLAGLWVGVGAAPWVVALLGMATLPLVWDIARNPQQWLRLDHRGLAWHGLGGQQHIALAEIDHVQLDRRFDFSMRITIVPKAGPRLRLPPGLAPPADALQSALQAHGISCQRHPFSLFS